MRTIIPPEYRGREQTYFKHLFLQHYLIEHGPKLASLAQYVPNLTLFYADVFAGPWSAQRGDHRDTSVFIGLTALREAREIWSKRGVNFKLAAVFVEKDRRAHAELDLLCDAFRPDIDAVALHGRFEDHADAIHRRIGKHPAFILVDPKGWAGAGIDVVAKLSNGRYRDLMIRVPSEVQRFAFRVAPFFGLDYEELKDLSPEDKLRRYCEQLKRRCGFHYAAFSPIPYGESRAVASWLAIAGRHRDVLQVFRDAEYDVLGVEAQGVREVTAAKQQNLLFDPADLRELDPLYDKRHRTGLEEAPHRVMELLRGGPLNYSEVWTDLLERFHIRESDAAALIKEMIPERVLADLQPRERRLKAHHRLSLASSPRPTRAAPPHRLTG